MPYTDEQKHIDAKGRSRGDRKRIRWRWARRRVTMLLRNDASMSDSHLSQVAGIGRTFVGKVRRDLEDRREIPKAYTRWGSHGGLWTDRLGGEMPHTEEQKRRWARARERIADLLREDPKAANRSIARASKTHPLTVASEREILEKKGEIPVTVGRRGSDGRVWLHK